MTPNEAASLLFDTSTLAPVNKQRHVSCEQAKAVLDVALKRLTETRIQDLGKSAEKPKGDT